MGILIYLFLFALSLYITYLIITVAVRHGIDNSQVGKMLKKKHGYQEEIFYPEDDLDKN